MEADLAEAALAAEAEDSAVDRTEAALAAPVALVTDPRITITTAIGARAVIIGVAVGLAAR